jgi:hypothetical protein
MTASFVAMQQTTEGIARSKNRYTHVQKGRLSRDSYNKKVMLNVYLGFCVVSSTPLYLPSSALRPSEA